jgi:HPt (histidine-containing phosphotransfer) domain-containing protein
MNNNPCLDTATVDKLVQLGGNAFARRMIDLFFDYVPQKLTEARAAEQAGNLPGIQKAVHPIKSSASNLGAYALKDLAVRVERLAIDQQADAIPPLLRELEAAYATVEALHKEKRRALEG